MGKLVVLVLFVEAIPLGGLTILTRDRWMRRRPQFRVRVVGLVLSAMLPELILVALSLVGPVGEQAGGALLFGGFAWGVLLVPLAMLLLFEDSGSSPGSLDDDPEGPGPGEDRPAPTRPLGGVPLPDAEQSPMRLRGPHSRRLTANRPRPAREHKRAPSRM